MTSTQTAATVAGLLAVLSAIGVAPAVAQNADTDYRRFCSGDYQRLCSAYSPGTPQVEQCFKARFAEVSRLCRDTINKYNPPARR